MVGQKGQLVYGVGINDSPYPVYKTTKLNGKRKIIWNCPFYRVWNRMLERCYSEKTIKRHQTYEGCSVHDDWHSFMNFKSWMENQDWEGKELDKDLLFEGNKVYGPETCLFITQSLNCFTTEIKSNNSGLPIGVWRVGVSDKFNSACNNPITGKREYLGTFQTADLAHQAWKKHKNEIAIELVKSQSDERLAVALRSRYL